jgi:hypothetical protein
MSLLMSVFASRATFKRRMVSALVAAGFTACSGAAMAVTYFKWEAVEMPPESGAACGNGTPYRVFVNRTPWTSKTVLMFEGGGACWDKDRCAGAHNVEGVAANYMSDTDQMSALGLVTPFTARLHPLQKVQTQDWNIVYVPYCTADVHGGDKVVVYTDGDPAKPAVTFHHRGARNVEALAKWLAKNMPKPDHLLVTGFSAGASGATTGYATLRDAIQPKLSTLLADSGPMMPAKRGTPLERAPSLHMHEKVRSAWGLDEPGGPMDKLVARFGNLFDRDDMGSITLALARSFPQDRLGFAAFQADEVFPEYSYRMFYPEITNAASDEARLPLMLAKWQVDLRNWTGAMKPFPNVGFYVPHRRNIIDSHCLTPATFLGTGIRETQHASVRTFIDNLISREGTVIKAYQQDLTAPPPADSAVLDFIVKLFKL